MKIENEFKMELENGNLIIKLSNYGYLKLQNLGKINNKNNWGITLNVNDAMCIDDNPMMTKIEFENSFIIALESMRNIIENIKQGIRTKQVKIHDKKK